MELKTVLLLALLGGASYYGYQNREEIWQSTGMGEVEPGRVRAVDMAKNAYTFDRLRKNAEWFASRIQVLGGEDRGWRVDGDDVNALDIVFEFEAQDDEGAIRVARYVFLVDSSGRRDVELKTVNDPFDGAPEPPR